MKNLSFFVSAFALCASTSYAAIDCKTLPTCESLGYTDTVANCPGEVLKCPFDTAKGKCQRGPSVGDLKYSLNTANHNGWILCNGQSLETTKYAALYNIIKSNYGMDGTKFRVPDYRGFFLRAYGAASVNKSLSSYGGSANSSLKDPQKEELPNIRGSFRIGGTECITNKVACIFNDIFSSSSKGGSYSGGHDSGGNNSPVVDFSAANTSGTGNGVFKDNAHVIPANYAANIFIYSGVVTPSAAVYRCSICGYLHEGTSAPSKCPACNGSSFTRM